MKYFNKVKSLPKIIFAAILICGSMPANALEESDVVTGEISYSSSYSPEQDITDYIPKFVDVPEGGVPWDVFAETESVEYEDRNDEGQTVYGVRPEFKEKLKKLDGQTILIQGYMFPLQSEQEQSEFLFGPFPVSCPYHYHAGPNLVMEVHSEGTIKFDWEPIDIKGRLELVPRDDEFNVFFRLHNAQRVK